ncbi:putative uncharacterized protein [Bacteroides sp. CAG:545]|nr:putative uncharacterized protein [Bacteroides sp. CAG:545]
MKHSVMFFLAIVATLSSFISCQKEIETPKDDITSSHTVSFVADAPRTKTNATVDGSKVNYSWAKGDEDKFKVYEIVGDKHTPASIVTANLKDGLMEISAIFGGEAISGASYQAVFNTGVKTAQTNDNENGYDQNSDVLVSEVVSDPSNDFNNGIALKFKRLVAVNKATLKNLEKGDYLAHTIIEATDKKDLAGDYSNITDLFENCKSKISVETLHGITGGSAPVNFITLPVTDTKLKVTAVTIDGNNNFVAAYEKTFSKGISLTQGNLTSFGVLMSEKTGETIDLSIDETTTATTDELTWDRALVHVMVLRDLGDEKSTPANNYYPGTVSKNYTSTRFYKNSTLAITPMNSLSVSEIVFTATNDGYATALAKSTWTNATASASGTTVSIIPTDGTKEVSAVISATTGHKSIEIIYGQSKVKEKHSVIISSDVKNGTITATPTTAYAGENITLTATPDGGYILSEWNVTTATGNVTVNDNAFVMPDEDVTVSAVFTKKGEVNDGSLEYPYTAAEAIAVIDSGTCLTGKHVKGIVKATPKFNSQYNSLTYDIESGEKTLNIYSGKDLGNVGFVGAEDLKAGDEVVVYGDLKKYNKTYELDKNNYLISINGETQVYRGLAVSEPKTAFNVGDAFELGGKILQVWRGKEDVDVTASANISGYDMSTEGKQTVTVTVGNESVTYVINVRAAGSEVTKTYTLTFGKKFSDTAVNGYTETWDATREGFTWTMANWNNNNAYVGTNSNKPTNWTYVKAGPKGNTNAHAKIETASVMPEAISKISITIDAVANGSITSIVLTSSATNDFTSGTTIEKKSAVAAGEVVFTIPSPQNNLYYQLDFTLNNTTPNSKKGKNGVATVSKVVYTNN